MPPKTSAEAAASHFLLSHQDIQLGEKIDEGSFGIVYRGKHSGSIAAIKQLKLDKLPEKQHEEFLSETEIMALLHHRNIIQLYGYTKHAPYQIVMEFMDRGSLFSLLHSKTEFTWSQRILWGKDIAAGLHYLHTRDPRIIHRDLKSQNILINGQNQAKLTDFGSAIAKLRTTTATLAGLAQDQTAQPVKKLVGSTRWMAPELFTLKREYTAKSDMFAYAVVLWELAARKIPFESVPDDADIKAGVKDGEREDIQEDWPALFQTLLPLCWHQDPKKRPSADTIIEELEKASPPEPIDPEIREAYIDSLIKPRYEEFLRNVAKLMHVHPAIFISYAWPLKEGGNPEEAGIQIFLERLDHDLTTHLGLTVIWDLKSLQAGQDIDAFMRRGVFESYRVLMMGTPTYAARAEDARTNVYKEISYMNVKRIDKDKGDSIIPLLYCGEWATSFPKGYNQVLAITTPCHQYLNFYQALPNMLISLLGLLPENVAHYNQYKGKFLADIERLIAGVTDEQVRAFNKESFRSSTQETQQILTRRCETVRHDYPTYQVDVDLATLQPSAAAAAAPPPVKPPVLAAAVSFFASQAAAKPAVDQATVETLLLHVARGEQEQAEAMLKVKGNETLLLHKGRVTDYSNRTFNSITAFQYALWALDWHMWKMILKYLPREEAAQKLQELESNGPGPGNADHGKQYDFTPMIKALKTYVDQFDALWKAQKYDALENLWIKGVGGAQCHVPAHVANEYCRRDRSFDPKPTFTEADLPRTFDLYGDNKFFPLSKYSWGSLSSDFSIFRGFDTPARCLRRGHCIDSPRIMTVDLIAITGLCEVRTGQYQDLKRELTAQLAARPR